MHADLPTLLRDAADDPTRPVDLLGLHRAARRSRTRRTVTAVTAVAATAAVVALPVLLLDGPPTTMNAGFAAQLAETQARAAVDPSELATLLADCLQAKGLEVEVSDDGTGIRSDDRVVSRVELDRGWSACESELEARWALHPGADTRALAVLHEQFVAYAECLREAGVPLFPPPSSEEFIADRQAGEPGWSPQREAERAVGPEAVDATGCTVPAPTR